MGITGNHILTVNAGSSSLKLALFVIHQDTQKLSHRLDLSVSNIGQPKAALTIVLPSHNSRSEEIDIPDHMAAMQLLLQRLAYIVPLDSITAIGHRLVHGGPKFTRAIQTHKILEADWELLSQLDPQHTPAARQLIDFLYRLQPSILQVACFDTSFFHDLPAIAQLVPIPQKYSTQGIRRYGFHGLSYTSILSSFSRIAGETAVNGRVIVAHLGSGASVTAMHRGQPVDTTMGLTPNSGVIMSSRSGDLDPNLFSLLNQQTGMTTAEFTHMVNFESGLLGISNLTADMHTLIEVENENEQAAAAIESFVRSIKKAIGGLTTTLDGLDSLIFSGGIGEQSAVLRKRICHDLGYLGIEIENSANEQHETLISSSQSHVGVHVVPSDEARVIASQTAKIISQIRVKL